MTFQSNTAFQREKIRKTKENIEEWKRVNLLKASRSLRDLIKARIEDEKYWVGFKTEWEAELSIIINEDGEIKMFKVKLPVGA